MIQDGRTELDGQMLDPSLPSPGLGGGGPARASSCESGRVEASSCRLSDSGSLIFFLRNQGNFSLTWGLGLAIIGLGSLARRIHFRGDGTNLLGRRFLNFAIVGRFQRITICVSSSTPASTGPALCQNWLRDILAVLPPNSFTVCMPKYW